MEKLVYSAINALNLQLERFVKRFSVSIENHQYYKEKELTLKKQALELGQKRLKVEAEKLLALERIATALESRKK